MPYNRLSTTKIARAVGCHPNTVRLYEKIGFISPVPRSAKGYRLYEDYHKDQMALARMAMSGAWPGRNIRRSQVAIIRQMAAGEYAQALALAYHHLALVHAEQQQAEAAAAYLEEWAQGEPLSEIVQPLQIGEVARLLNLTIDQLRNWERNHLLEVPRDPRSRYRKYGPMQVGRLRVIRLLMQSGYSPMAILRMLLQMEAGEADLRSALDTPRPDEDVYTAADHWLSTLAENAIRAEQMIDLLSAIQQKYGDIHHFR